MKIKQNQMEEKRIIYHCERPIERRFFPFHQQTQI